MIEHGSGVQLTGERVTVSSFQELGRRTLRCFTSRWLARTTPLAPLLFCRLYSGAPASSRLLRFSPAIISHWRCRARCNPHPGGICWMNEDPWLVILARKQHGNRTVAKLVPKLMTPQRHVSNGNCSHLASAHLLPHIALHESQPVLCQIGVWSRSSAPLVCFWAQAGRQELSRATAGMCII